MATGITTAEVIQAFIDNTLAETHMCLPARVVEYEPADQKAAVQPMINKQYSDGEVFERAVIKDVPIIWPGNRNSFMTMPVNVGDIVLVLFVDKSIDRWRYSDGELLITPDDRRIHDYSDAVAIPGVYPFPAAPNNAARFTVNEGSYDDVIIKHNVGESNREVEMRLKQDGSFVLNCANQSRIFVDAFGNGQVDLPGNLVVNCPLTTWNGDIVHNGNLTHTGNTTHTGTYVQTGSYTLTGPAVTTTLQTGGLGVGSVPSAGTSTLVGPLTQTGGDITSDGISVQGHTHNYTDDGSPAVTDPPN